MRFRLLALAPLAGACHQDHSSDSPPLPSTGTSNLGLTLENVLGSGSLRLVDVSEARQGEDLNGDGDRFDRIAHVVDLDERRLVNTGLAPGFPNSSADPLPVVSIGETLAFARSSPCPWARSSR